MHTGSSAITFFKLKNEPRKYFCLFFQHDSVANQLQCFKTNKNHWRDTLFKFDHYVITMRGNTSFIAQRAILYSTF